MVGKWVNKSELYAVTYRNNVSYTFTSVSFVVFDCDWFVFFDSFKGSRAVKLKFKWHLQATKIISKLSDGLNSIDRIL